MKYFINTKMFFVRSRIILAGIVFSVIGLRAADVNSAELEFQKANDLFRSAKYEEAKQIYIQIVNQGLGSSKLYYNLGNACFKTKNFSYARLYYEKALLLNPSDEDIQHNLELVKTMTGDKTEEVHPFFLVSWANVSAWFSSDGWAYCGLILLVAFVVMLLLLLFNDRYVIKKIMFISAVVTFFLSGVAIAFSAYRLSMLTDSERAIVGLPTVSAKSSPTDQGTDLFIVHEGTNVQMLDSVANWREIRLPDGNRGWVEKGSLMPI
jgi:hypothetical protein